MKEISNKLIILLGISIASFVFFYLYQFSIPYEDASILFSYAENLANTGIISYFPNGSPAEGATDFLFMIMISILFKLGIPTYFGTILLNFFGALLAIFAFKKLFPKQNWLFLLSTILFLILPQMIAGLLGYGTIFYAGITITLVVFFIQKKTRLFFLFCLLHFLIRPIEGFVAISFCFFYLFKTKSDLSSNQTYKQSFIYFLSPIIVFWIWRTYYFGHLFPLPYYIKTNFEKWLFVFNKDAIYFQYKLLVPFSISLALLLVSSFVFKPKPSLDFLGICFSLIILPILMYSTADLDMNFALRYQTLPFLGVLILGLFCLKESTIFLFLFLITFSIPLIKLSTDQWLRAREFNWNNMYFVGQEIYKSNNGEGRLATTESGILPWQTKMTSIDLWGLNSPNLAQKLPSTEELIAFDPDIIVIHPRNDDIKFLEKHMTEKVARKNWENMTLVAFQYASDTSKYSAFLVPYDLRSYDSNYKHPWFSQILNSRYGIASFSNRKDLYFIKKEFEHYSKTIKILEHYGSTTYKQL
ncbi:MAG: hypothetical protein IPN93_11495 [Bacteroidetes bacterium]|nr:hypothetical protein [Bacteroidota bacterium]